MPMPLSCSSVVKPRVSTRWGSDQVEWTPSRRVATIQTHFQISSYLRCQPWSIGIVRFNNTRVEEGRFSSAHSTGPTGWKDGRRMTPHRLKGDSIDHTTVSSNISNYVITPVHGVVAGRSATNKPQNVACHVGTDKTTVETEGDFMRLSDWTLKICRADSESVSKSVRRQPPVAYLEGLIGVVAVTKTLRNL